MASLNQLLLSVLRFLSFISIAALAYTPNRLQSKHAKIARKPNNAFGSAVGFLCHRISGPKLSSPTALLATVEDSVSADKPPNSNGKKDVSKFADTSPLTYSDFHVVTRTQSTDEIKHLELYLKWRKGGKLAHISSNLR